VICLTPAARGALVDETAAVVGRDEYRAVD
jgi:hypothetical protein